MHAEDGVDFMTIHCGMNRATAERFKKNKRLMNIVSRGGSIMFAWMEMTGEENPFYEHFDEILDICQRTGCRVRSLPGIYQLVNGEVSMAAVKDVQVEDLLGQAVEAARKGGVSRDEVQEILTLLYEEN